jgi:hypothetical protein
MSDHMRAELVVDALQMALARRRPQRASSTTQTRAVSTSRSPSGSAVARPASRSRWASAVAGGEIAFVDVPDEAVRDTLLGFGMDEWLVGAIVDLGAEYRRCGTAGYPARVTGTVQELAGHEPRSLDQLLEESWPT